jgi:hypothetical protein
MTQWKWTGRGACLQPVNASAKNPKHRYEAPGKCTLSERPLRILSVGRPLRRAGKFASGSEGAEPVARAFETVKKSIASTTETRRHRGKALSFQFSVPQCLRGERFVS